MKIKIDPRIIKLFPNTKIGVLIAENLDNKIIPEEITMLTRQTEAELCKKHTLEDVASIPKIMDWREAYRLFGCKPSEYRSSIEALLRRVLQAKQLPSINPIVDIYNLISIKYMLPAGGGDLDKIKGTINLTIAQGTEHFVMLGSSSPVPIKSGEVIYSDDNEVLCRAWNYREADKTKITEETKNVYLLLEGLEHTSNEEITTALSEMTTLISSYCQGSSKKFVLDKNNPEMSF